MYRFGGAPSEPSIMSNNKSLYRPKSSYGVTKVNPISEVDNKNWPRINVPFNVKILLKLNSNFFVKNFNIFF
jgi:hypothetical protein